MSEFWRELILHETGRTMKVLDHRSDPMKLLSQYSVNKSKMIQN